MTFPPTATIIRIFRGLAIAEAFSWAALLVGMVLKWVTRTTELGVEIAGPIHGAFFIGYAAAALSLWAKLRWPFRVALLSGLSAVFPFATIWFERWAGRRGHLNAAGEPARAQEFAGAQEKEVTRDDDDLSARV